MKKFMGDNFLLNTESAKKLYHDYAETMPILDYHCHSHASHARVELHMAEGELTMIFTDDGAQYDPTAAEEPDVHASADDREPGGLGIFMVKKMTRDMRYEHSDGLNRLTLVFNAQSTGK